MKRVFVAIPTPNGEVCEHTRTALACVAIEAAGLGWTVDERRWIGDSIVSNARNALVAQFLQSDCTHMLCVDSDVAWGPGAFTRMMTHPVDFVAGVYRVKGDFHRYAVRWLDLTNPPMADGGLVEAAGVPFGFVRLTRSVIERLVAAHPERWYTMPQLPGAQIPCLFEHELTLEDHLYWGEDFVFCKRWRALGGQVFVDPELPLVHVAVNQKGEGKSYAGHLGRFLRGLPLAATDGPVPPQLSRDEIKAKLAALFGSGRYDELIAEGVGKDS